MAELTVDLTYGNALYQAATELGMKDTLLEEGTQIAELLDEEPEFGAFLKDPVISAGEKKKVLKNIFEGRCSKEMLNFLFILADKGRAGRFPYMMKEYRKLADREEGVAYGSILSAAPLSGEQIKRFEEETSKLFQAKVSLANETNPDLIGGVRILVNGRIIDMSLRKRLDDMADSFNL